MKKKNIRIVTRGDDAGACRSANEAIRDCCLNGILRNASFMAHTPEIDHAIKLLSKLPNLCCGLHTNFTSEFPHMKLRPVLPVEQVSSIVDSDGYFWPNAWRLSEKKPKTEELVAEFKAQLALLRSKGLDVKYIDQHMMLTPLVELRKAMTEIAEDEKLVLALNTPASWLLPPNTWKILEKEQRKTPIEYLLDTLKKTKAGDYVLCGHPCYNTEEVRDLWNFNNALFNGSHKRDWERRMFMDEEILSVYKQSNITAIQYLDLED